MITLLALFGGPAHSKKRISSKTMEDNVSTEAWKQLLPKLKPNMIIVFQVPVIMIMIDTN